MRKRCARWGLPLAAVFALLGCRTLGYYAQAVRGGLDLACRKRPIARLLADGATDPALRERLARVLAIRDFASRALALPDNRSYRSYAELGRPYAVWNVVAAPELSLTPLRWCFPVAGCVAYRGYFAKEGAERFARRLTARGYDVDVGGASAYSTLGWLADPILNTFLDEPEPELAGLLFHELAHQVAYVRDDTTFNESFATAVEVEGVARWLAAEGRPEEVEAYRRERARRDEALALLLAFRARLAEAYAAPEPDDWKRARKAELLAELRAAHRALTGRWGAPSGYEGWLDRGLNNARLASLGLYHEQAPAFASLLASLGGDLPRFYAAVRGLAKLPPAARRRELEVAAQASAAARPVP